jgi:hypothetical protein
VHHSSLFLQLGQAIPVYGIRDAGNLRVAPVLHLLPPPCSHQQHILQMTRVAQQLNMAGGTRPAPAYVGVCVVLVLWWWGWGAEAYTR